MDQRFRDLRTVIELSFNLTSLNGFTIGMTNCDAFCVLTYSLTYTYDTHTKRFRVAVVILSDTRGFTLDMIDYVFPTVKYIQSRMRAEERHRISSKVH
jgi:hypothetical protein